MTLGVHHKASRGYRVDFLIDGEPAKGLPHLHGSAEMTLSDCLIAAAARLRTAGVVATEIVCHVGEGAAVELGAADGRWRGMLVQERAVRGDWLVVEAITNRAAR